MPAIERVLPVISHIPDWLREILARRFRELIGLALLGLTAAAATALVTWSVQDPSLSYAASGRVRNIMGYPGAIGADLAMQIIGLGVIMLVLPIAVWGWRMLNHRAFDREVLRLTCWLLATITASGFASAFVRTLSWPLPTGLGGVVGDALMRAPAIFLGPPDVWSRAGLAIVFGSATAFLALYACGLWVKQPEPEHAPIVGDDETFVPDEDRGSVSLGFIMHALMSLKAQASRAFSAAYAALVSSRPSIRSSGGERMEPNLGRHPSPPITPEDVADDEADIDSDEEAEQAAPAARKRAAPKPRKPTTKFELPPVNVLAAPKASDRLTLSKDELDTNSRMLEGVLGDFGVRGEITKAHPGPVVTLYELEPAPGIKSSRVIGLADDIARSMSATAARVAVVPGRNAIGIELPNEHREKVYLRELIAAKENNESVAKLPLCLGKNIGGHSIIVDLAKMPHLLIAGTTGSGKSVAINTMILSLLYRLRPDQCRLIMVDPKMLELSVYDGIPHLLTPVVTDPKKAVVALKWAVREMEQRYKNMSKVGVRNIDGYNARLAEAKAKGEEITRTVHTGFDKETGKAIYEEEKLDLEPLPYIVIIVDEMADLMMVAGKDIEGAVQRLAQMARAAGLHVILATQRPSVDVITGTIKANFPTRISFQVTSKIDSRTILGEMGAEQLLGQGDMLYMAGRRAHQPRSRTVRLRRRGREDRASSEDARLAGIPRSGDDRGRRRGRGRRSIRRHRHGWRRRRRGRFVHTGCRHRQTRPEGLDKLYSAAAANRL